ncbi:MAG: tetratricopeptide repeat protein [Bacteroidota bacterium]
MGFKEIYWYLKLIKTDRLRIELLNNEEEAQNIYNFINTLKYPFEMNYLTFIDDLENKGLTIKNKISNDNVIFYGIYENETFKLIGICYCELVTDCIVLMEFLASNEYIQNGYLREAIRLIIQKLDFHDIQQFLTFTNVDNKLQFEFLLTLGFSQINPEDIFSSIESSPFINIATKFQSENCITLALPKLNPLVFDYYYKAFEQDDYNVREELFSKAINLEPRAIFFKDKLAWNYLDMAEPEEALELFNQILIIKPNKFTSLLGRAYAYSDIGNIQKTIDNYVEYLSYVFFDDDTYIFLGDAYIQQKEYYKALVAYEEALKINPENKIAKVNRLAAIQLLN